MFQLVEHTGVRLDEVWDMPVAVRKWWIDRKSKELQKQQPQGPGHTDPFGRNHPKK